jgi:hypothetical protein
MNDTSSRSHAVFTICLRRFIKGDTPESTIEKISRFRYKTPFQLHLSVVIDLEGWSTWQAVNEQARQAQQGRVSARAGI